MGVRRESYFERAIEQEYALGMSEKGNILDCFIMGEIESNGEATQRNSLFRSIIWGKREIAERLKKLQYNDYGKDLELILFSFYINPVPSLLDSLKEIGSYRSKEKSISISIAINNENFFGKSESERDYFLKQTILQKLNTLATGIKKKKLDTDMEKLIADVEKIFGYHIERGHNNMKHENIDSESDRDEEQLLKVTLPLTDGYDGTGEEIEAAQKLERAIIELLEDSLGDKVDGNDVGMSEYNIYIHSNNTMNTLKKIRPLLKGAALQPVRCSIRINEEDLEYVIK